MAFLPKTSGVALLFLVIVACAAAADLKPLKEARNTAAAADKSDAPKVVVNESHLHLKDPGSNLSSHTDTPTETTNQEALINNHRQDSAILHSDVINPKPEPTSESPNVTTTTSPAPKPPTTSSPNVTTSTTTTTPAPKPTTLSPNVTTTTTPKPTTLSPNVTTTTPVPTTVSPNITTTTPAPAPAPQRNWSAPSFFGGMVLAFGIVAVGFVGYRFFYLGRGGAYHTL